MTCLYNLILILTSIYIIYIYVYIVGVSEIPKLKEIQEKDYDVADRCAFRLYDPKHTKSGEPMYEYGSGEDTDVEVVAFRKGSPKPSKKRKGRKRKRVESDSEYEPDPNYNNRKRRKIAKKHSELTKKKVCNCENITFYICLFFFVLNVCIM